MSEPYEDFEHEGPTPKWPGTGEIKTAFFGSSLPLGTTPVYYETFDNPEWGTLVKFSASYNDAGGFVESFEEEADEMADAWGVPFPISPDSYSYEDPTATGNWTRVRFDTSNTVEGFESW